MHDTISASFTCRSCFPCGCATVIHKKNCPPARTPAGPHTRPKAHAREHAGAHSRVCGRAHARTRARARACARERARARLIIRKQFRFELKSEWLSTRILDEVQILEIVLLVAI